MALFWVAWQIKGSEKTGALGVDGPASHGLRWAEQLVKVAAAWGIYTGWSSEINNGSRNSHP